MSEVTKTTWHGLSDWVAFFKASIALGTVVIIGVYAMLVYALEDEFAPKSVVETVKSNQLLAQQAVKEIGELQVNVTSIQLSLMSERLFNLKIKSCAATSQEAKVFYAQQLTLKKAAYREMNGHQQWIEPSCDELQ